MKLVKVGSCWVNPDNVSCVASKYDGSGVAVYFVGSENDSVHLPDLTVEEVVEILNNAYWVTGGTTISTCTNIVE